jgi:hypothetical protein
VLSLIFQIVKIDLFELLSITWTNFSKLVCLVCENYIHASEVMLSQLLAGICTIYLVFMKILLLVLSKEMIHEENQ